MIKRKSKIIFEKIGIENFGPFSEFIEINFSTDKEKNVTLITGEIGSGKTTIFQLFWWVLFPEELEKEKKNEMGYLRTKKVLNAVNEGAIRNCAVGDQITLRGFIKFVLRSSSGNNIDYVIERERSYRKIKQVENLDSEIDKSEVLEHIKNSDKILITKNGKPISFSEYLSLINDIFPKSIRTFAFIHGEGITRILSIENIGELKSSVLSISDHPKIKGLKQYLDISKEYFNKQRKEFHKDSKTLQKKNEEIEKEENLLKRDIEELTEKQELYEKYNDKILELTNQLNLLNQNREYIENYRKILDNLSGLRIKKYGQKGKKKIKGIIEEREEKLLRYAPYIYLEKYIDLCLSDIQEKRKIGIIPGVNIPEQWLKVIINRPDTCICATPWNKKMEEAIKDAIKTSINNSLIDSINLFEGYLQTQKQRIEEGKIDLYNIQKTLLELNDEINNLIEDKLKYERNLTEEQKSENAFKQLQVLYAEKERISNLYTQIADRIKLFELKIDDQKEIIKKLKVDYAKLENEKIRRRSGKDAFYYKDICDKLENLEEIREKVENNIGNRIREETRKETENNLIQLVRDPDQWQNITITETSSGWQINAKFGDTIIDNISTGMTNVLGLSFIFALSHILGVDLPLVFDSPLGNLDATTRELIVENLPPIFKGRQIIFLEKKINLMGGKENKGKVKDLYPKLKEFIEYEYEIINPTFTDAKLISIK